MNGLEVDYKRFLCRSSIQKINYTESQTIIAKVIAKIKGEPHINKSNMPLLENLSALTTLHSRRDEFDAMSKLAYSAIK